MTRQEKEQAIDAMFDRGTIVEVLPSKEELRERLLSGEKVRVKFGIDPTSPNIHIGRAVPLLALRDLQNIGCEVVLIVGDFTGQIGDTSDKDSERPMLSEQVVKENMTSYLEQAFAILDKEKTFVFHNSSWLGSLTLRHIGEISTLFSLAEFISRENIKKRLDAGKRISLRELLYPLMQGYDSFVVGADIEVGGTDQRFNMLAGREIQRDYSAGSFQTDELDAFLKKSGFFVMRSRQKERPQCVLMNGLIEGIDGRKMSSSWGNTINIIDTPREMFGKTMRIPDEFIETYFRFCTRMPMEEIEKILEVNDPRSAKIRLAKELVRMYHNAEMAEEEERFFVETFSNRSVDAEKLESIRVASGETLVDVLVAHTLASSRGDARRKIEQGGVSIDGEKMTDATLVISKAMNGAVLRVGKKRFVKLEVAA